MQLHEYVFRSSGAKREPFYIVGLGDLHYGAASFDHKKFAEIVNWIAKRPTTYWVGLGDYVEAITYRDLRRFSPENIDPQYKIGDLQDMITHQVDGISKLLTPIKDRCIGVSTGNHEFDALRNLDHDITARLAQNLRVKNMGWTCLTRLVFKQGSGKYSPHSAVLIMLTEHSNLAGRKKGSKINRIEDRFADFPDVDILLWGHSHDKVATTKEFLYLPRKGELVLKARKAVAGIVPSFYNTYAVGTTTYGERRGYSPTATGIVLIEIKPFQYDNASKASKVEMHISQ